MSHCFLQIEIVHYVLPVAGGLCIGILGVLTSLTPELKGLAEANIPRSSRLNLFFHRRAILPTR